MSQPRETFVLQVHSYVLEELGAFAQKDGREVQSLIDEALEVFVQKRRKETPKVDVMTAYYVSQELPTSLYKRIAE